MSILFYDNVGTGHHSGYLAGIVGAAEKRGLPFVVAAVEPPPTLAERDRWIEVAPAPLRSVIANRRQLAWATRLASDMGASVLVDLYLDKQIWAVGAAASVKSRVHVLHHAEQYALADRVGTARLRTIYLRNRLRRLAQSGAVIVVHNRRTADILAGLVEPERLIQAGYPVHPLTGERRPGRTSPPTLLFVGAGRSEKGLDLLFEALAGHPDIAIVRIVGRQPAGLRDKLTARHPQVRAVWLDDFVDEELLHQEYMTADLAVLPYRSSFGLHGGPSSVLLETVSAGLPITTTTALADQLPDGYDGAELTEADSADALAESLLRALNRLEPLTASSASQGPPFITADHTFDSYLDRLLAAIDLAGN